MSVRAGGMERHGGTRARRRIVLALSSALVLALTLPVSAGVAVGEVVRVTVDDGGGQIAAPCCAHGTVSADGRRVAFFSWADVDGAGFGGIFVRDLRSRSTVRASILPDGSPVIGSLLGLSPDGREVMFMVAEEVASAGEEIDVYVRDVSSGTTTRLDLGVPAPVNVAVPGSSQTHYDVRVSDDLSVLHFILQDPAGPGPGYRVELGAAISAAAYPTAPEWLSGELSADGSRVAFSTTSRLALEDTDGLSDVYLRDVTTDTTTLLSDGSTGSSVLAAISGDGNRVFYVDDGKALRLYDLVAATRSLLGGAPVGPVVSDRTGSRLGISHPTTWAVYTDTRAWVYEVASQTLAPASRGVGGVEPDLDVFVAGISADGSTLLLSSEATNLVTADTNHVAAGTGWDLFVAPILTLPFEDLGASIFAGDVLWLWQQQITRGCAANLYCPDGLVSRGQMAAFLNRALGLPAAGDVDTFTDDDGSIFEDDIEAIAAAGITRGCNPEGTRFCPDGAVTRGEMAAFIVRALELRADTSGNPFTDDDGSIFEDDIETIAAAGITRGCNPEGSRFCPDDRVTRGQMAAFLHRAFGSR